MRGLMTALAAGLLATTSAAFGQAAFDGHVKVGVLNDQSSLYADATGQGSVVAARMALEDYMKANPNSKLKVELIFADHQNKPDIGSNIARQWIERDGVDMILDVPNSAVALAVNDVTRQLNKVMVNGSAGTVRLTGDACSPNTVHWTFDNFALANGTGRAVVSTGGDSWFFITADYAFGHDLEKQASDEVVSGGGKIVGSVRHPIGTSDFSSFILQAQASGAQVIALANAGGDTVNTIKQAAEYRIARQKIVALIFDLQSVPALGLKTAEGLTAINAFYWDMNDQTRAWSRRYQQRHPAKAMPNHMQAGVYAGALHYLKAVDKVGSPADGRAVVQAMKDMPTDDPLFGPGQIRADGRKLHPMYLLQVKTPTESKNEWDVFKITATIPADQAFRPLKDGGCPLV